MLFHLKYIHVLDILVVLEDGPLSSQRGKKIFNVISILLYDKISNYSIYILQCFQGNYKCPIFLIQASKKKTLYVTRSLANIYCNVNKKQIRFSLTLESFLYNDSLNHERLHEQQFIYNCFVFYLALLGVASMAS